MFLERLRRELKESIQIGAALASAVVLTGCGEKTDGAPHDDDGEVAGSSNVGPTTSADAEFAVELDPLPADMLGCFGPTRVGGFASNGQCCFTQRCYDPADGEGCDELGRLSVRPPGSGTCSCDVEGRAAVTGPFARNPSLFPSAGEEAYGTSEGRCCYVVGSIGCEGRPFVVSGAQRVAVSVWRNDWGLFA